MASQYLHNNFIAGIAALLLLICAASTIRAQTPTNADYRINPPLSEPAKSHSMVMLTLSGDHQIFLKAYNDYDDLDGDGLPDVTYNHNVIYKGYFNEHKCYTYSANDGRFNPTSDAIAPTAGSVPGLTAAGLANRQYCLNSAEWSGNFLNWATMTRIDIVRSVLYGGMRSTDTANRTVLERAYLPNDAHSFAKYYNGNDITKLTGISSWRFTTNDQDKRRNGLTFCNTSLGHAHEIPSQNQTNTRPVMRVVSGNYSLWTNGERYQCLLGLNAANQKEFNEYAFGVFGNNGNDPNITGIHAYSDVPDGKDRWGTHWIEDYIVRVAVCTDNTEDNIHYCRRYGASYKPTGLLQTHGIHRENPVMFGLMTGASNKNKTGGVLRKNIGPMSDEVNPDNGVFLRPSTGSIIASIDSLKIFDYYFQKSGPNHDNFGSYNFTCPWFRSRFDEGKCRSWGNPFSEILAESYRYLAGNNNAPRLDNNAIQAERTALPSATVANWQDPINLITDKACINMNVLGVNSSSVSYDGDIGHLTFAQLGIGNSDQTIAYWTDLVGNGELNSNKKYFVGSVQGSTTSSDGLCTPKTVTNLSTVRGTCPETPRLEGGYLAAGLAYYVKANNVRPDVTATTGKTLNINTLGLTLAGNQPVISVPDTNVKIVPACRNNSQDPQLPSEKIGNCALVGFQPIYTTPGQMPTKYFITWEDTEQGSDYDQDINGIIEFSRSGNSLTVTTTIFKVSTGVNVHFGYIISGTTQDGLKLVTQVNPLVANNTSTYTIGSSDAESLQPPLFYATKWGSYTNSPEHEDPQFDPTKDIWSDDGKNPLNYAVVTNPSTLRERMGKILTTIGKNSAAGTAAPVSINTFTGEGIFLQTLYQPVYVSPDGSSSVSWVGTLSALFLDRYGNVREDSNSNKTLDNSDKVIEFITMDFRNNNSEGVSETRKIIGFNRYPYSEELRGKDTSDANAVELGLNLDRLKTLWDARDQLANITDANIGLQRGANESANQKRLIITGIDKPNAENQYDGIITATETLQFVANNTTAAALRPYLDVANNTDAANVINYIRGKEISGYRNRTVKFDSNSSAKVWRLGDIVNSTPAIVGPPSAGYDTIYEDASYAAFRSKYAKRRNMVYVGANDGLLHAFNAGFFDSLKAKFTTTPTGDNASAPALGAEMWAYAPYNLLPHLKWLTQKNYEHVYYVDANVRIFDAKIFAAKNNPDRYPNGWGTILAVGMRYGGGEYEIDRDGDPSTNDKTILRSAYILFDVTDPESPPELIAEISAPDLGFTLADPEIIKHTTNDWFMVFGSGPRGPKAVSEAISNAPAKLFYLDLKKAVEGNVQLSSITVDSADKASFVGGITAKDWNNDYIDDMLYFGLVGDNNRGSAISTPAYKGALKQAVIAANGSDILTSDTVSPVLSSTDANLAFSSAPLAVRDGLGTFWIFAGTGRFFVARDVELNHDNFYFGIKVNDTDVDADKPWLTNSGVALTDLRNISNDRLYVNNSGGLLVQNSSSNQTLDKYLADIATKRGWYRKFATAGEANFSRSAFFEGTLVFNTYRSALDKCEIKGNSPQYILDMFTGLPQYRLNTLFMGSDTVNVGEITYTEVSPIGTVIDGVTSSPVIADSRAITQSSDASLKSTDVALAPIKPTRKGWRQILLEELR